MLNFINKWLKKKPPPKKETMKVWNVEVVHKEQLAATVRVEIDGQIFYSNILFADEQSMENFLAHFRNSIEPFEIEL